MPAKPPAPGRIAWTDLTVGNAGKVRDFYRKVAGWKGIEVPMGGYSDYAMAPRGTSEVIAGICHARGANADLPPVWLLYVVVARLTRAIALCEKMGGSLVAPPRPMGKGKMCVVRDPAGAMVALYELPRPARRKR
jgi:predicted enzyme related to lactoylglutathione lyase